MPNNPHNIDRIISTEIAKDDGLPFQEIFLKDNVDTLCEDINTDSLCIKQTKLHQMMEETTKTAISTIGVSI